MTISNPKARRACYYVFTVITAVLGSIAVFCGSTDAYMLPDWVQPATAAVNYLGAAFGLIAASNVDTSETGASEPAAGEPEPGTVPAAAA